MRCLAIVVLLAGCRQILGFEDPTTTDSPSIDDGGMDAAILDAPDAFDPKCFASGTFSFCLGATPSGTRTINGSIDTTLCATGEIIKIGTTDVCVVSADAMTVSGPVGVMGDKPLVLLGVSGLTIGALLNASGLGTGDGAGGNPTQCAANNNGANANVGAGGGAGGSFGTRGGNGGNGGGGVGFGAIAAIAAILPTTLRGGCRGGNGGAGSGAITLGGRAGGAIMLVTRGTLTFGANGIVNVSGAGGAGGSIGRGGGAGGGSGGMIVIDANAITFANGARMLANGGGGGGGAGIDSAGDPGSDPLTGQPTQAAPGGQLQTNGRSQGGDGAAGSTLAEPGANGANGGGGGGGGHGIIRVLRGGMVFPGNTVSPTPTS